MPMIHVNGIDLHYHQQGKGVPIVFIHPPCIGSRVFTYLRNDLSRDHRTLLFDFRGHGRSGTSRTNLTIPLLVEDTRQLMDSLDISSAYLCAYSVASMVALEAMLTHPDRFRGAVLLGGMAEASNWKTKVKLRAAGVASRMRAKDLVAVPILWVNADNSQTLKRLRGETLAGDVAKWRDFFESARRYSAVSRLPDIKQPVLLVCGERDSLGKKDMRTLQEGLPDDSSAFIPGMKHFLPTYAADPIGDLMRGWIGAQEGLDHDRRDPDEQAGPEAWIIEAHNDPEVTIHT
jgi:pimeloyl-ACP methyl ester carboxylesterase